MLPFFDRVRRRSLSRASGWRRPWPLVYVSCSAPIGAAIFCGDAAHAAVALGAHADGRPVERDRRRPRWRAPLQGAVGGVMWGGWVAAFLAMGWILFRRHGGGFVNRRNVGNVVLGTLGGIIGGISVFAIIFFVVGVGRADQGWMAAERKRAAACRSASSKRATAGSAISAFAFGAGAAILAISAIHAAALAAPHRAAHPRAAHRR